ncbi:MULTISPECIES: DUF397 domain-containing protein [unclassified Streptomyces]|uniref:DUF397 domain-containing protein n=1 Tax=unclassified Streptomyces TaxID=2593676 RepID=UPI001660ED44|nr:MULTISPECIES: DUF397 domain-containing protein [unclassified Streptomyces]MBD0709974.1 DUF397 domain-containing protein [Streptomyces sp. CBMA291]MBD0717129.1 DUF397 domain-containing protein [Streptomyces sp. CBMA370]
MTSTEPLVWFKSSYSAGDGGQCVEIAAAATSVHVRDSKDVTRPALRVSRDAWAGFVGLASGA